MPNIAEQFEENVANGMSFQYHQIKLGKVANARQIMHTAKAYQMVYERPAAKNQECQANISLEPIADELDAFFEDDLEENEE